MADIYTKISFQHPSRVDDEDQFWDYHVDKLYQFPFTGFEEDYQLIGYIAFSDFLISKEGIIGYCKQYGLTFEIEQIKDQNWNEEWEKQYPMVVVDDFCAIIAPFHEQPNQTKYNIHITPEMSFGTGHHQTTYMMIQHMSKLNFTNKDILDYGCGTGLLAILASKLGAKKIDAIDYDIWSYRNSVQNCINNDAKHISVIHGELVVVNQQSYDIILANINKHVILSTLDQMYHRLKKEGKLLLSGILEEDRSSITQAYQQVGFNLLEERKKDDWISLLLLKNVKL